MNNDGAAMEHEAMTFDTFFAKYEKRALLLVLVGNGGGPALLRVARMVWEQFPAYFPDVATVILDGEDPREAGWVIGETFANVVGSWDICVEARAVGYGMAA